MINPILISIKISVISTFIVLLLTILLAKVFIKNNSSIKNLVETLLYLPIVLPPSVVGYFLLSLFSRNKLLGKFLYDNFNIQIIFSTSAAVIASVIVSLPLMYQSIKGTMVSLDPCYSEAAKTLGANEKQIFFLITLPMCWSGILSGIILAFARSMGEFGATLMVLGNMPGKTQTIPLAIYFAIETGDKVTGNFLVGFVTAFSFSLIFLLNCYLKKKSALI